MKPTATTARISSVSTQRTRRSSIDATRRPGVAAGAALSAVTPSEAPEPVTLASLHQGTERRQQADVGPDGERSTFQDAGSRPDPTDPLATAVGSSLSRPVMESAGGAPVYASKGQTSTWWPMVSKLIESSRCNVDRPKLRMKTGWLAGLVGSQEHE